MYRLRDKRSEIFQLAKIDKQLANISDIETRQQLTSAIIEMIDRRFPSASELQQLDTVMNEDVHSPESVQMMQDLTLKALQLLGTLMDAYILPRMFRSFQEGPQPRYIVSYAGQFHIDNQVQVLQSMGFQKAVEERTSDKRGTNFQCVDTTGLSPYFTPL